MGFISICLFLNDWQEFVNVMGANSSFVIIQFNFIYFSLLLVFQLLYGVFLHFNIIKVLHLSHYHFWLLNLI